MNVTCLCRTVMRITGDDDGPAKVAFLHVLTHAISSLEIACVTTTKQDKSKKLYYNLGFNVNKVHCKQYNIRKNIDITK